MTKKEITTVSKVYKNSSIVEMLYDEEKNETSLVIATKKENKIKIEVQKKFTDSQNNLLVPYTATNILIAKKIIFFPSTPQKYKNLP